MRLKRPIVLIPAAIALVAVAALLLLWLAAYTPFARRAAGEWIAGATGLPASVERLRIGYLSGPSLTVGGLAIAQPRGFGAGSLAEVGSARIELPWSALFGGAAVDSIAVADAVIRPALAADGSDNWSALIERLSALGGEGDSSWSIGELGIERGAIEFEDAASGTGWRLTAVTLRATDMAPGADFPVDLRLAGIREPNTLHLALNGRASLDPDTGRHALSEVGFRGWGGGDPLPLAGVEFAGRIASLSWNATTATGVLQGGSFNVAGVPGEISGDVALGGDAARMSLRVKTETFAPRAPAVAFGRPLPRTADPGAFGALQAAFTCALEDGVLRIEPFEAQLDDTRITGSAVPGRGYLRLAVDRIDLDRYLTPGQESRKEKKATLEAGVASLRELDLDAEIRIAEASVAGAKLHDTVVRVERGPAAP